MAPILVRGSSVRSFLALIAGVIILSGCGGGSTYSYDEGSLAQRFLPTDRSVAYPPDSLGALTITKSDGTYQFELESDYEALHRKWSSTYQGLGTRGSQRGSSYATLWSLELSLASLQPEFGITALSEERAEKRLKRRRGQFKNTIQIDVIWFEREGESNLAAPGNRVELQIGEDTYQPAKENSGPLRETFLSDQGRAAIYRRNIFYFPRIVDGADILEGAQGMELRINPTSGRSRVRFAWSWETGAQADVRLRGRRSPRFSDGRGADSEGPFSSDAEQPTPLLQSVPSAFHD
jgi:hypothetical protein